MPSSSSTSTTSAKGASRLPFAHIADANVWCRCSWTYLTSTTVVPVVPPQHDGYPRFLSAAWPYYAGAFSTSAAFILFVALWLAGDDREPKKNKGTKAE